jgi:hypothetical protein
VKPRSPLRRGTRPVFIMPTQAAHPLSSRAGFHGQVTRCHERREESPVTTVTATRSELLSRRSREGTARRGHALLTRKRAAPIGELLGRFPRRELTRIQQDHLDRHDFPAEPGSGGAGR